MTGGTSGLRKFLFTIYHCSLNRRVIINHAAGNGHRGLKYCGCGDVSSSEFVHETITVGINADPETLLRLHAVMVIECVIRKMSQRNNITRLVEWPDNQT